MSFDVGNLDLLLPVMARILSAFLVMPIFGHRSVPAIAKIVLAVSVAFLLVAPGGVTARVPSDVTAYLLGLGTEILLGLLLGFAASLTFWALGMAGDLVGLQMGWGFGGTIHPSFESSPIVTGQFYNIMGTLVFLVLGGQRLTLVALSNTFTKVPPFTLVMSSLQIGRILDLVTSLFSGAVQLALPIVGTLLLTEVVLAFLTRVMPQLNAWVFGMPLKVGIGILTLWISLPAVFILMTRWLTKAPFHMQYLVK